MKKKVIAIAVLCSVFFMNVNIYGEKVDVDKKIVKEIEMQEDSSQPVTYMDENGNIYENSDALNEYGLEIQSTLNARVSQKKSKTTSTAMIVNFKTKPSTINTSFINEVTGQSSYTNGSYGVDGAYLGTVSVGGANYVRFMQAGAIGRVLASEVQILNYDNYDEVKACSYYAVRDGYLVHVIAGSVTTNSYVNVLTMGEAPSYLSAGVPYYSYDGHYFYTSFEKMIGDYNNPSGITYLNSMNQKNPYFNYYQFLSHRSQTNIQDYQFDEYTKTIAGTSDSNVSKMINMGKYFTQYQNEYGANGLLMYAVAANESNYGKSDIAIQKNNLFGHSAYDSSAGTSASGYFSPDKSIYSHARYFISEGYLDPLDAMKRYFGGHLGDKASGINVKYASDPYWGEKAANIAWNVSRKYGATKDSTKYPIAIKNVATIDVKKSMSTQDTTLYNTGNSAYYPFIILVNSNGWLKVQSDPVLSADRSKLVQDNGSYDFSKDYAYIPSSDVLFANNVAIPGESIMYSTHIQDIGWQGNKADGGVAGTVNQGLRMEAIQIQIPSSNFSGNVNYQTHVENIGWQTPVKNGQIAGTTGKGLRVEAIRISLDGVLSNQYDVYYSAYVESYGWLGWAKNGESSGSSGLSKKMEAIKIQLVKKGESAPGSTLNAYVEASKLPSIKYQVHVQDYGWMNYANNSQPAGTVGQSKRLEGMKIDLNNPNLDGSVSYQTHVQDIGWQSLVDNNQLAGTTGKSLRLEAFRINLTGNLANQYDIYYRAHVQNFGWLGWAKNGSSAGSAGYGFRMEAIEIKLVEKNTSSIIANVNAFKSK